MPYLPYLALAAMAVLAVVQIAWHDDRFSWFVLTAVAVAAAWFLAVYSTGRGTPFGDFDKAYYPAGRVVLSAPSRLYDCAHADGLCFVNIPVVALLFSPLSMAPLQTAHVIILIVGLAAVGIATAGLVVLFDACRWRTAAIVMLVAINGPLYYSLRLANLTHVVLAIVVAAFLALSRRRRLRAGALLGGAALIKPPFVIWLPYLLIRRQWTAAAAMCAVLGGAAAASIARFGLPLHAAWFEQFIAGAGSRPIGAYNVQSISGFLVRLMTSGTLVNWQPVPVAPAERVAQAGLSLAVLVLSGYAITAATRQGAAALLREQSIVLCAMLLLSPISWTHYYCFLLVPLAGLVSGRIQIPVTRTGLMAAGVAALLVSMPVMLWVPAHPLYGAIVARILLSHYVFGCALLLTLLSWPAGARVPVRGPTRFTDVGTETAIDRSTPA